MSTAPNPVMGMVNDPDFQKLPLGDQRRALTGLDKSFGSLSDADFTRVSQGLKSSAPSAPFPGGPVPGAPGGVPPKMSAAPYPQELKAGGAGPPIDPISGQSMTQIQAQGPPGKILPVAGATFGSVLGPGGATLGAIAGEGLKQTLEPSANPPLEMLKSGGKMAALEAGGKAIEYAGGKALYNWITSSKSTGAQLLQAASAKAGNAPIELSPRTNELVEKLVEHQKLGGKPIKVISDLLERVGPSTKLPAEAPPNPLTYDEARILQSNISQLSTEEQMGLKGAQKGLMKQLAGSFSRDVQNGADAAGIGTEHAGGMREYAMASARNRALATGAKMALKGAIGGGIGYELLRNRMGK